VLLVVVVGFADTNADCFGKVDKDNSIAVMIAIVNKYKIGLFFLQWRSKMLYIFLTTWYITFF
jgi:hypothetical protein